MSTLIKLVCVGGFLWSALATAADLSKIFTENSQTSTEAATAIQGWLTEKCKDLKWALRVDEVPTGHEQCGNSIEKVQVEVELSHLTSQFIFWVKHTPQGSSVDWVNEEWPSWHVCSYSSAYSREDKTCTYMPYRYNKRIQQQIDR